MSITNNKVAMNDTSYFNLVKEILIKKWSGGEPLSIKSEDLTAGMVLLTKIAVEAISNEPSIKKRQISAETEPPTQTADKIKAFVEERACAFRSVCQTGFPFSLLESASTKVALKCAIENYDSILSHFLNLQNGWMSERELNERFAGPFQRFQVGEISEACSKLKRAYTLNNDNQAGYYLLWLIKQAAGCNYEIPEKNSFNNSTVGKVLSQFVANSGSITNGTNFVEILHYRSTRFETSLYHEFLDRDSCPIFLAFSMEQLQNVPMEKWTRKAYIITNLLETVNSEYRLSIAKDLALSKDPITSRVGNHLIGALTARSFREAVPHFSSLEELLPHFNPTHVEIIFNCTFSKFCEDRAIYKKDPEFTKRLRFNGMRKVFVYGSQMIGVYESMTARKIPPYLFAYDMKSEKMVWGIPLKPRENMRSEHPDYSLKRVGEYLSLQLAGEKKIHFIHPETGEFNLTFELPGAFTGIDGSPHISPEGFVYQVVNRDQDRILIGGRIVDKKFDPFFETKSPRGLLSPFSTHCGFHDDFKEKLVLFGPTGDRVRIKNCLVAKAHHNQLCSIEKDPVQRDKCLLTIRTLKMDKEVVSSVEKSISINARKATFGDFCQNGQLILFAYNSPIFVDLSSQQVTYSQHKFPSFAEHFINADSGELWTWDQISKKIWKVSSTNIQLMGSLESGRGTTFLHVDKGDRLYFVDIPF